MRRIKETGNEHHWPRHNVEAIACREYDFVIRIADWTRDEDEPAYDVECYIGGIYDWNESDSFTFHTYGTKGKAKAAAREFAQTQITKLL